jgi:hypothetical protein
MLNSIFAIAMSNFCLSVSLLSHSASCSSLAHVLATCMPWTDMHITSDKHIHTCCLSSGIELQYTHALLYTTVPCAATACVLAQHTYRQEVSLRLPDHLDHLLLGGLCAAIRMADGTDAPGAGAPSHEPPPPILRALTLLTQQLLQPARRTCTCRRWNLLPADTCHAPHTVPLTSHSCIHMSIMYVISSGPI